MSKYMYIYIYTKKSINIYICINNLKNNSLLFSRISYSNKKKII